MRLLMVVQRYGPAVPGGAETAARLLAEHMAGAGHDVSVLTSCAIDYATWEDHMSPGTVRESGVTVTRLPVVAPRDPSRFDPLSGRVFGVSRVSPSVQQAWMHEQGPILTGFADELRSRAADVDVVSFMTYLYPTTVVGLPLVAPHVATVLHPTAHDELPFRLPIMRASLEHAAGLAYFSAEEQRLVELRCRPSAVSGVVPVGIDLPDRSRPPDIAGFRHRYGLGDDPYLLCLGRVDPNKGAAELLTMFERHRAASDGALRLVMMGAVMMDVGDRSDIVLTGFVDDETKREALAGASVLVQPSRQESFSIALAEAWSWGVPVLVQEACEVLAGFTERAGGGLSYGDQATFDASLGLLMSDPGLRSDLGASGRRHVDEVLDWPAVVGAYESLLRSTLSSWTTRPTTA